MEHHFNVQIAEQYGIEEAILIHHFYYWISKNAANGANFHDGLYWTYNSKKAYAGLFTYMNETKIFRVIKHLEECGLIVKSNYNEDKWDRTNWYAISIEGIYYLQSVGYDCRLLQNGTMHCAKMNDALCQNEQSILINNTNIDTNIKEKDEDIIISSKKTEKKFVKPTIDEIKAHILEKGYMFDAEAFYAFYESNGWKVGKNPMKNWKMACTTWAKNRKNSNNNNVNYGRETITDKIRRSVEEANIFSQQLADRINSQQQADVCDGDNDEVW